MFQKLYIFKKPMNLRRAITFFRRKLFVSQQRNIPKRKHSVLCFRNFPVAKNYWIKESWRMKGISRLSVKNLCLRVPKNSVEDPFCVSKSFSYRKILSLRREYHDFPSKVFCLTVPKYSVGESFSLSINSGIEKVWMRGWRGGVSRSAVENFVSHSDKKFRRGTL